MALAWLDPGLAWPGWRGADSNWQAHDCMVGGWPQRGALATTGRVGQLDGAAWTTCSGLAVMGWVRHDCKGLGGHEEAAWPRWGKLGMIEWLPLIGLSRLDTMWQVDTIGHVSHDRMGWVGHGGLDWLRSGRLATKGRIVHDCIWWIGNDGLGWPRLSGPATMGLSGMATIR